MHHGKVVPATIACFTAGLFYLGISSNADADPVAYMTVNGGNFGTVDLTTGVFSLLGNSRQTLAGLGEATGTLFGTSFEVPNGTLYSINPANGTLTAVGSSAVTYFDLGSTPAGLFALDTHFSNLNLYSINPASGAPTLIGPTGLAFTSGTFVGLSTNSSLLYFSDLSQLYSLNTSTGAATLLGPLGDSIELGALILESGTLYGGEDSPSLLVDTVSQTTGAATTGPGVTGAGSGEFFGLAPLLPSPPPAVPEPATFSLLGSGIAMLAMLRRRKSAR